MYTEKNITLPPGAAFGAVFGDFDRNANMISRAFDVSLLERGGFVKITGETEQIAKAEAVLSRVAAQAAKGGEITEQYVRYLLSLSDSENELVEADSLQSGSECVCITHTGKPVKPKTLGQKRYVDSIKSHTVTFAIGPAGTGKSYLAVALAVRALKLKEVNRILLTRPAVEAGEKLGFLPGDLQSKIDPYLRPLVDALYELFGGEALSKLQERGTIEVAPLAYMRGRTLDDSFIILDEAQNTTPEQMKMFLTRLGNGSRMVINGDITQTDLPGSQTSGLVEAMKILQNVEDISFCRFTEKDVVRHKLVQAIVKAYEKYDGKKEKTPAKKPGGYKKYTVKKDK